MLGEEFDCVGGGADRFTAVGGGEEHGGEDTADTGASGDVEIVGYGGVGIGGLGFKGLF